MEIQDTSAAEQLVEIMSGLSQVKRWFDDHPEVEFRRLSIYDRKLSAQVGRGENVAERFAAATRALMDGAPKGAVMKHLDENLYSVSRDFGGFTLNIFTGRDAVCEAKVVGTETVRVPDPQAPMVTVEREIVEWVCPPILSVSSEPASLAAQSAEVGK